MVRELGFSGLRVPVCLCMHWKWDCQSFATDEGAFLRRPGEDTGEDSVSDEEDGSRKSSILTGVAVRHSSIASSKASFWESVGVSCCPSGGERGRTRRDEVGEEGSDDRPPLVSKVAAS